MVIPVFKYIQILRIISEKVYNVNAIIRHTGKKNKKPVLQILNEIEKEGLIIREKDSQKTQYEYITLTRLGQNILRLVEDFEKFKNGYYCLIEKISYPPNGLNTTHDYDKIKNDLKGKKWKEEDIESHIDFLVGINFYKTCIIRNISDIITNRCLKLFMKHTIGETGISILKHITNEVIDFKLSNLREEINYIKNKGHMNNTQINAYEELLEKSNLTDISRFYYFVPPNFNEDLKDSFVSYINLISPSNSISKSIIEEETNMNDLHRAGKKSNNHTNLGGMFFAELGKKGHPYSTIASIFFSNIAKDYNPKPDSRFIKSVYNSLEGNLI